MSSEFHRDQVEGNGGGSPSVQVSGRLGHFGPNPNPVCFLSRIGNLSQRQYLLKKKDNKSKFNCKWCK